MRMFLIKTDFMLFPDINDLLKALTKMLKGASEASDLYESVFEKNSTEYLSYINRELETFHRKQLPEKKDNHVRLTPTLQTQIDKRIGFDAIINDNSFSSIMLCEGDINNFGALLKKISEDLQHPRQDSLSLYIQYKSNNNSVLRQNIDLLLEVNQEVFESLDRELKRHIKDCFNIDIGNCDLSLEDLDMLKNESKKIKDKTKSKEIDENVQEYLETLMMKNGLVRGLNQIIEKEDLSNNIYINSLDDNMQKYIKNVKDKMDEPNRDEDSRKMMSKIVNRLILEGTYSSEISNILKYEIDTWGIDGCLSKYT
jgi:hypothetical protein